MVPSIILLDPIHNDVYMTITMIFPLFMSLKDMDLLFLLLILLFFFNNPNEKFDLFVLSA